MILFNYLSRGPISGRKLQEQTHTSVAHTKARIGHRNWDGVLVFGWNASVAFGHVAKVLQRFYHFLCTLVSLLFFISGRLL